MTAARIHLPPDAPSRIRLELADIEALSWLLQRDYEGDLGVRSSWESQVHQVILRARLKKDRLSWHEIPVSSVTSQRAPAVDERVVEAATRLRVLGLRWGRLVSSHRTVLAILFEVSHRPPAGWGELWPVVVRLPSASAAHVASRSRMTLPGWLEHIRSRPAKWLWLVQRLEAEAQAHVDAACDAWRATGRRTKEVRRAA